MKLLVIIAGMLALISGAGYAYYNWHLYLQASMYAEGYSLSSSAREQIASFHTRHRSFPHDNLQAELPPEHTLFGTSVKRIRVIRDGALVVEFSAELDNHTMVFTPGLNARGDGLAWHCASDSIPRKVLARLRPHCDYTPETPEGLLVQAIANRDLQAAKSQLRAGARTEAVVNGNTPLMLAARIGDARFVRLLLEAGAAVDHARHWAERRTPLMVAVSSEHAEIAMLLLSRGASPDRKDYSGRTALDYARLTDARNGNQRFELLVAAGQNPRFAGEVVDVERVAEKALPGERGVAHTGVDRSQLQVLHSKLKFAVESCHAKRLVTLLREVNVYEASDQIDGQPVSAQIVKPECSAKLKSYLEAKPVWLKSVRAAMATAIERCDVETTDVMLRDHPTLDLSELHQNQSLLGQAVHSGCPELLNLIIRKRDLVADFHSDVLVTVIQQVSQQSLLKTISVLINAGAELNTRDAYGRTPLATAIAYGQPVVAKYLLGAGADVNMRTENGSTPLIEAAKKGNVYLVDDLLSKGADVHASDSLGRTALHAAVAGKQRRIVTQLKTFGANPRQRDANGVDAVVMAESFGFEGLRAALLQ
ncbi:MAG: ankyrin repeat domain-containing protein [Gammaproteobacteria bacterium]|nr:ankyrin repeat domain-containing protein [Gammaproteobacteria bacterium]